eukprot:1362151-Amphidinium_carterae.1
MQVCGGRVLVLAWHSSAIGCAWARGLIALALLMLRSSSLAPDWFDCSGLPQGKFQHSSSQLLEIFWQGK